MVWDLAEAEVGVDPIGLGVVQKPVSLVPRIRREAGQDKARLSVLDLVKRKVELLGQREKASRCSPSSHPTPHPRPAFRRALRSFPKEGGGVTEIVILSDEQPASSSLSYPPSPPSASTVSASGTPSETQSASSTPVRRDVDRQHRQPLAFSLTPGSAITLKGAEITESILRGFKDVENRSIRLPIGWVALHTGKGMISPNVRTCMRKYSKSLPCPTECPMGAVVGLAYVSRSVPMQDLRRECGCGPKCQAAFVGFKVDPAEAAALAQCRAEGREHLVGVQHANGCSMNPFATGPVCNVIAAVYRLRKPVYCQGSLGVWRMPEKVRRKVEALCAADASFELKPRFRSSMPSLPRRWPLPWLPGNVARDAAVLQLPKCRPGVGRPKRDAPGTSTSPRLSVQVAGKASCLRRPAQGVQKRDNRDEPERKELARRETCTSHHSVQLQLPRTTPSIGPAFAGGPSPKRQRPAGFSAASIAAARPRCGGLELLARGG